MHMAITEALPLSQAAQLYKIGQEKPPGQGILPFSDDHDYLHSLEKEASLLVVMSYVSVMGHPGNEEADTSLKELGTILQIPEDAVTSENITDTYHSLQGLNRLREAASKSKSISLAFNDLCTAHNLNEFERNVLMVLLMLYISREFRKIIKMCGYKEEERDDILQIGTIFSILCIDFRNQLSSRHSFSLDGKLVSEELIVFLSRVKDTTNILDAKICIHERAARQIIGDNNIYHSMFGHISRERSNVRLEQVVLPDGVRDDILTHMRNFLKSKREKRDLLDQFFGYGTGLVLFFHGPSGTGKTMLAKALANHFNCQIFSLDTYNLMTMPGSWEKIFNRLFKEATLQNAIVFFDEADDLFEPKSHLSRAMLIEIEKSHCITIFSTNKANELDPALERRISMKIHFPFPDENTRHELWRKLLPDNVTCASDVDLHELAEGYRFNGGTIKNTIFLAVNTIMNTKGDKRPLLTRTTLIDAAEIQSQSMMTDSHICRTYTPQPRIADLPLGEEQKRDLYGIARAYEKMKNERLGFNLLVCASDIDAGKEAVQGLALECGLKIREFFYSDIMNRDKDDSITDPISQRKMTPLEYAFSERSGNHVMTVILDYGGLFRNSVEDETSEFGFRKPWWLTMEMKFNKNMFCMVTLPMKSHTIPVEFNLILELEYPSEDMQVLCWKRSLTEHKLNDDELRIIIKQYPMHLSEITFIGRQVSLRSIVQSKADRPAWMNIKEVISQYRKKQNVPLLFGNRG